ncbi:hypothetical protein SynPROS91_00552 [Synechococcus sp. PROS-9-1]|nr:hypothetical protein SynPROS91_00552 [Synechococcus sp. PROS-9-1]
MAADSELANCSAMFCFPLNSNSFWSSEEIQLSRRSFYTYEI